MKPSDILIMGLNHKTAPVELRECIAFSGEEAESAIDAFREHPAVSELVLISTCNRVEILMTAENPETAIDATRQFLSAFKRIPVSHFGNSLYVHKGDSAVRHVFRVAASLDSMMVGEPQILGQIKEAYRIATRKKSAGVILNRLFHKTFSVAKRIRTETGIGDHAVSISYAAIELGKKIFGSLEGKKALLIGAGEMAELAVEHLIRNRSGEIFVANRTFERGVELADRYMGTALRFEEIPEQLKRVDIIISSTGAPGFVIEREEVRACMKKRKNRPLFFIDIAVPRDIDPDINRVTNCYVYDIDDLKGVVDENIEDRRKESIKAERIIDEAVIGFRKWFESLDVVPTIVDLRTKLEKLAAVEVEKTAHSLALSEKKVAGLHRMTRSLINKILHDPTLFLKGNGCHSEKSIYIDITRKLFRLDE